MHFRAALIAGLLSVSGLSAISQTTTYSFTSRSYLLNSTSTGHSAHCYKIATLPANDVADYDHLHLLVNVNMGWAASMNSTIDVLFGNRNSVTDSDGFTYTYTSRGVPSSPQAKLVAYMDTDSANLSKVDIYLMFADVYATASYTVLEQADETVYATPTDLLTATPSGTLVFDSSSASYPPTTYEAFNGQIGIGTTTPTQSLSVAGNVASAGAGYGFLLRTATNSQNTVVAPQLLNEGVVSGTGTSALPWGTNIMSIPWVWGQDQVTYHGGFHDFRVTSGNTAEKDIMQVNGGGIIFPGGNGASIIFSDGSVQSVAWNGLLPGGDYAESVDVSGDALKYGPGDVLIVDPEVEGRFLKSTRPYSTSVTGVYSTRPGVVGRRQKTDKSHMQQEVPMAMTGIVPTKVSAENGPIKPGDLLVTASEPGYAMKGTDRTQMLGAVIGKSLGRLESGTGMVEVVISLQ